MSILAGLQEAVRVGGPAPHNMSGIRDSPPMSRGLPRLTWRLNTRNVIDPDNLNEILPQTLREMGLITANSLLQPLNFYRVCLVQPSKKRLLCKQIEQKI